MLSGNKALMVMDFACKTQLLIGAASSGSGKTTLTLGLLRALRNRGISVQPYKCGPDYIDTQYHSLASGRDSVNLDLFMGSGSHLKDVYTKYGSGADACIIEGVMGLFDGYSKMEGSSARVAENLGVPVLLVINAKSVAYSVAPLIYGFKNFYKGVKIGGIIFNMVGSERHYNILKDACSDLDIPVLGYIPKDSSIEIPSRHLGLTLEENYLFEDFVQKISEIVEKHIDVDKLLDTFSLRFMNNTQHSATVAGNNIIAIARDEAFNFIYKENLDRLSSLGKVEYFSPLCDKEMPECNLLYLPGGYPELHLKKLSGNKKMLKAVKNYIENGGKTIAECGGMMYLCNSVVGEDSMEYEVCGVLGQTATMVGKRLHIGYRQFEYNGIKVKGHEFHYSRISDSLHGAEREQAGVVQMYDANGKSVSTALYRYKNLIAGYTHLYWGEFNPLELF